jgi:glutathione S-transferase
MTDLILHHYPNSPFSEKIRLIFGAKKLAWKSVVIPAIMPKPDVVALTGGYRKTPILQIGADIYCDSALIAKRVDELAPSPTLYPAKQSVNTLSLAQWADTAFFQVAVSHVFKPANLMHMFGNSQETLEAFTKDRAAMRTGATTRRMTSLEAMATAQSFLAGLDRQFAAGTPYVTGDELSVADFSVYHCLWFMRRAPTAAKVIEPYTHVGAWLQKIKSFGHGQHAELTSTEAVVIAQNAKPQSIAQPHDAGDIRVGDPVEILPTDYGIDPTPGHLVTCTDDEFVIRRIDARATDVFVHFPRINYELRKAS